MAQKNRAKKGSMKKYIVTGGAGFIGSHLVDALVSRGNFVVVVDNLSSGRRENINPKAEFIEADIRHAETLEKIVAKTNPDGIFHMAAIVSVQFSLEHPEETFEINVTGTKNVFNAAKGKRIVFSSSSAVYGDASDSTISENTPLNPKSPYGEHKKLGEQYATVALRYFNVYGPRQRGDSAYAGVIARFMEKTRAGKPLTVFGDGSQTRDFVHVSDVVAANITAMEADNVEKESINIGSGVATSVKQIALFFAEENAAGIEYLPPRVEPKNSLADINKASKLLNWKPRVALRDALKEGIALLRDMD